MIKRAWPRYYDRLPETYGVQAVLEYCRQKRSPEREVANLIGGMLFPEQARDVNAERLASYIRAQISVGELYGVDYRRTRRRRRDTFVRRDGILYPGASSPRSRTS